MDPRTSERHRFPLLHSLTHRNANPRVVVTVPSSQVPTPTDVSSFNSLDLSPSAAIRNKKVKNLKKALLEIMHEDHPAVPTDKVPASYATPAELIELVAKGGVHKAHMTVDQLLIMGFMGGCFVGLGGLFAYSVTGDSPFLVANPGLSRLVFGILFPVALVMIILTGSELYTGNAFTLVPALLNKQISFWGFVKNWVCVYVSNCLGALFTAYFFGYWAMVLAIPKPSGTVTTHGLDSFMGIVSNSTVTTARAPIWTSALIHSVELKVSKPLYTMFLQGIGANWCVCLAVFLAYAARDALSKVCVAILPVAIFVVLAWEHCIANSFLIPLGMMYGAKATIGQYIVNLVFVTLGNTVGGVFFVGIPYWYVYHFREMHHETFNRLGNRAIDCILMKKESDLTSEVHDFHGAESHDDHHDNVDCVVDDSHAIQMNDWQQHTASPDIKSQNS